jgi:hypothetical protein
MVKGTFWNFSQTKLSHFKEEIYEITKIFLFEVAIFNLISCNTSPTCNKIPIFFFLFLYFSCRGIWQNPLLEQHEKIEK